MTKKHFLIITLLAMGMGAVAIGLGNWAQQINPDGIAEHPGVESEMDVAPRNSYYFGMSMGLLGMGLLYCCVAFGLLIYSKSKDRAPGTFVYSVAGLAVLGFALSYIVDDYFY